MMSYSLVEEYSVLSLAVSKDKYRTGLIAYSSQYIETLHIFYIL